VLPYLSLRAAPTSTTWFSAATTRIRDTAVLDESTETIRDVLTGPRRDGSGGRRTTAAIGTLADIDRSQRDEHNCIIGDAAEI
jgi:hypothetical protein